MDEDTGLRAQCMDSITVKSMSSGYDHAALISTSNILYVWGDNSRHALGFETRGVSETRPGHTAHHISMMNNSSGAPKCVGHAFFFGFRKLFRRRS